MQFVDNVGIDIDGYLKIYENDQLIFDDKNAIIYENFLQVIGDCMNDTRKIHEMRFGSGTGTINNTDTVSGLFTEEHTELVRAAGNQYNYTFDGTTLQLNFSVTMGLNVGNGTGSVNYTECGLFDNFGKKLTHITFPAKFKNNTINLRFEYIVDITFT